MIALKSENVAKVWCWGSTFIIGREDFYQLCRFRNEAIEDINNNHYHNYKNQWCRVGYFSLQEPTVLEEHGEVCPMELLPFFPSHELAELFGIREDQVNPEYIIDNWTSRSGGKINPIYQAK